MAGRIRTIKPEILEDEKVAFLSHLEFRIWVGTWLVADDHGNLRGEPDYLRGQIVWGSRESRESVAKALDGLESAGLLTRYTVRGQTYYHITNWDKHQRIDKPGKERMPTPSMADDSTPEQFARVSRESREESGKARKILATDLRPPTSDQGPPTSSPPAPAREGLENPKSDHQRVISAFYDRYAKQYDSKPTIDAILGARVNRLLKKHPASELIRRLEIMFTAPPQFLSGGAMDMATFEQHIDKFVKPAGPNKRPEGDVRRIDDL